MALLNPPGFLHNASPAVASGQMDRLINIMSRTAPDGSGITALAGVRGYNDFKVTANGTPNMSVNVAEGFAFVNGTQNPMQGTYVAINDGTVNLTITAANATNPRRDLIVLRIYDSQYSGALNTSALEVITGTASVTPADPIIPNNCLLLARVAVAANATSITAANVTDLRKFTASIGGDIPVLNQTDRDALVKRPGLTVYRLDTNSRETWNAGTSTWGGTTSSSGTTGITAATGWSLSGQQWTMKSGMCTVAITLTRTGGAIAFGSAGNISNQRVAILPSGMRPVQTSPGQSGAGGRMYNYQLESNGDVNLTSGVPNITIATNDTITVASTFIL